MGRRALRRVDPSLDLSRHLLTLEAIPAPTSGAALFGREVPLEIEIGSGKGLFLAAAAASVPERDFLGIEILGKYARFVAARLVRRELANARAIHGDAQHFFHAWLAAESVAAVHVYFPRSVVESTPQEATRDERVVPGRRRARAHPGRHTSLLDRRRRIFRHDAGARGRPLAPGRAARRHGATGR